MTETSANQHVRFKSEDREVNMATSSQFPAQLDAEGGNLTLPGVCECL